MNIILISAIAPPVGGIATWTAEYLEYCKDKKIDVRLVNIALTGKRSINFTGQRSIFDEIFRTRNIVEDLKAKIRENIPDVLHINTSCSRFGIFRDALCIHIACKKRIPVVLQCHCNIEDQLSHFMGRKIFKRMVRNSTYVIVLNTSSLRYVETFYKNKTFIIPNYINIVTLSKHTINRQIERVVYVGRVQKSKGSEEIFEVAKRKPQIEFRLIGSIAEEIKNLKKPGNVKLIGNMSHLGVMQELERADIFLFPSYSEGFALVMLEAMASGLPIIASDVGANKDMIANDGGIIVPARDADSICNAIDNMEKTEMREKFSAFNQRKVKNMYSIEMVMGKIINIYRQCIRE